MKKSVNSLSAGVNQKQLWIEIRLDCVAAVKRLPALHYSVDFISCPLGSWVSLWNFETIRGSLMKPK